MAYSYSAQKNVLTYPFISLRQIEIIQNILAHELRDATKILKTPIGEQLIEQEDTRYSFLQSVELYGSLVYPFFLPKENEMFNKFVKFYNYELVEALKKDKEFADLVKDTFGNIPSNILDTKVRKDLLIFLLNEKCKRARTLLRELLKVHKDNNYLEAGIYSEGGEADDGQSAVIDEHGNLVGGDASASADILKGIKDAVNAELIQESEIEPGEE